MMGLNSIHRPRLVGGVVFILVFLAGFSRVSAALAAEDKEDYSEICSLGPTAPLLVASAYPDYQLVNGPYYEITETASIDATHRVQIHTESCVDRVRTTFQFRVRDPATSAYKIDDCARYARAQILKLHLKESMTATNLQFMKFLDALPVHAPDISSFKVCMDTTIADDDGCSWRTGGSLGTAFEKKSGWMVVTVFEDFSY